MDVEQGFNLDIGGALRRRALLIGAVAGGIFLVGYWVAMALPNEYEAYATLLVQPQAVNDSLVRPGVKQGGLNERLHLMAAEILSRPRLSKVIDDLDLYESESRSMSRQEVIDLMRDQVTVKPVLPELESELRIQRRNVVINTFRIFFRTDDALTASVVAQRLANDFIKQSIDARVAFTQKSLAFITAEQDRLLVAIQETAAQIAEVKDANTGSLPEDLAANQRLAERTLMMLRQSQRSADVARSDESFWATQSVEAAAMAAPNDDASPVRRKQLLELELNQLRARRYTDKHPDIVNIKREIETLEGEIAGSADGESDAPVSLAQRTALAEKSRATLRLQSATREIERLQDQLARVQTDIENVPRVAEQLDAAQRRLFDLTQNMHDYNDRQLEAGVQANLERKQLGEQFRIIEPAFKPPQPSSPNRLLILMLGLVMGLGMGVTAAIVSEAADSTVHGARDLQTALGVPVLAAIPAILLEPDRLARRRKQIRLGAAAAAVVLFCLIGGAVTYLIVNGGRSTAEQRAAEQAALRVEPSQTRWLRG